MSRWKTSKSLSVEEIPAVAKGGQELLTLCKRDDHLYRHSATKKYYAVFKSNGKTKWIPLNTTDQELAGRKLRIFSFPACGVPSPGSLPTSVARVPLRLEGHAIKPLAEVAHGAIGEHQSPIGVHGRGDQCPIQQIR
jgi:hypothetical protein